MIHSNKRADSFGQTLCGLMRRRCVKFQDVRRATGVSHTTFSGWRTGGWHPNRRNLEKLFQLFPAEFDRATLASAYCRDHIPQSAKVLIQIMPKGEPEAEEPTGDFEEAVEWLQEWLAEAKGEQAEAARRTVISVTRLMRKHGIEKAS